MIKCKFTPLILKMMLRERTIKDFQKKVLDYYTKKRRDLPWRHTTDPYCILISEVMLQQTQVDRVIFHYNRWLQLWPTIKSLACTNRSNVLATWSGLGYNRRAVNLHRTAKIIMDRFSGNVLQSMSSFKELPGIGPYTAAAVRIFSGNEDLITVDTNIRRILIHEFGLKEDLCEKLLWGIAERCLPRGKSRDWHNALMDYGSLILTAKKTGIRPKTRQSAFNGSTRQLRGIIMKSLLSIDGSITLERLRSLGEGKRLELALGSLIKDGLIESDGENYHIKEH